MKSPEEVAERWVGCKPYPDLSRLPEHAIHCRKHVQPWPCQSQAMADLADLIRARDVEITELVRAETLAGFTEERAKFWEHDEGTGRLRRATTGVVCTRLVGPWEPVEP